MAELVAGRTWSIQGETLTLPIHITDAEITAAVFAARPAEARRVLDGTPLRPYLLGGRAWSLLMCLHYGPWALKSYDEVGVGLLAAGPGGRPGLHLVDLPVTGEFTREAGQDFWALPKWLMRSRLEFGPRSTTVQVHDGGTEVLSADFRHGWRLPVPVRASLPSWSYLDHGAQAGRLLRGRLPMNLRGVRVGRSPVTVRLSAEPHPMARRMRALGMLGRPVLTVHADRLTGPLGPFRPLVPRPRRPS